MSSGWGPSYGDPSHPTTSELPKVGDGLRGTGEIHTVQIDTATDPNLRRTRRADTGGFASVGTGRGSVGPVTVQIDRIPAAAGAAGVRGDTTLLPRFMPERAEEPPPAKQAERPDFTTAKNMPVRRRQLGPDWTQMPLRLLGAAVVALAVLGLSAASLLSIAEWINP